MQMICDLCGQSGIRWMGPLSNLTHTECPHCGGINCQRAESAGASDEEGAHAAIVASNEAFREVWKVAIIAFDEARWLGDVDAFDAAFSAILSAPMKERHSLAKAIAPEIVAAPEEVSERINAFIDKCQEAENDLTRCGQLRDAENLRKARGVAQFCIGAISDAAIGALLAKEAAS